MLLKVHIPKNLPRKLHIFNVEIWYKIIIIAEVD